VEETKLPLVDTRAPLKSALGAAKEAVGNFDGEVEKTAQDLDKVRANLENFRSGALATWRGYGRWWLRAASGYGRRLVTDRVWLRTAHWITHVAYDETRQLRIGASPADFISSVLALHCVSLDHVTSVS
jgi:hypothetical protein